MPTPSKLKQILKHDDVLYNLHEYGCMPDTREVFLHGWDGGVDEEPGVDYRMAATFMKNMNLLDRLSHEPILVHMSSIGGMWNDGMAIFDTIKIVRSPVIIVAYAHARSMTSIILQAADLRLMTPHTDFMIHYGSIALDCNSISAKSEVAWNEKTSVTMLEIYVRKCKDGPHFDGWSEKRIETYLKRQMESKQEVYMTAEDAVDKGFADGVIGTHYELEDIINGGTEVEKLGFGE